ncbi:MAG TPA: bifunctional demethylmenaquinone methyltransferase/2-methoxy-6-polyprenyl-1,4-benzoquinol methylase UbiE [Polyangia bacterium]|jgi:demethylmenaquinone methyltransferase/2-methoxy-6-polyprenyl-1,4-benzoquinol methylase|nr:bifunctional demethylmenaquinone methyltransferase/2-methoxy-6-polyprenyl-1,4-benzoquinol methylase UbiE [Polyangia bacterium]
MPGADLVKVEPRGGSGAMFDNIAPRYDLLNRVLSFGVDRGWRRRTVRSLGLGAGGRVLDVATGTGDLALLVAKRHPDVTVFGVDPSAGMLAIGHDKIQAGGLADRVHLTRGDAENLPFADGYFDAVTIAFGIRNVPDRRRGLAEMARVTKAGGRVAILELGEPPPGLLGAMARFHIHTMVPRIGALLSGAREYRYLHESIARFPSPEEFAAMMTEAGLEVLSVTRLTFGVATLYVGTPGARP